MSLAVLFFLMLLACFLSWADQQFGGSVSVHSGESSEVVSEMALAEIPRQSPPPSYSSNSGVPVIYSQVAIGESFE